MKKKQKLWFKRKRYGWGWVPVTWQGVAVIIIFLATVLLAATFLLDEVQNDFRQPEVQLFFLIIFVSLVIHLAITYKKGPSPKWRWGKKPSDDPKQDF